MTVKKKIQLKRATAAQWADFNPVLSAGEIGVDLTNHKLKVGDGTTAYNSLPYVEGEIDLSNYYTKAQTDTLLANKVDATDLANYYTKSQTYSKGEVESLLADKVDASDLATVATTGDYNDLSNKPAIPDVSTLATKTELADGLAEKEDAFEVDTPLSINLVPSATNVKIENGNLVQSEVPPAGKGIYVDDFGTNSLSTNILKAKRQAWSADITNIVDFFAGGYVDIDVPTSGSFSFTTGSVGSPLTRNFTLGKGKGDNFIPITFMSGGRATGTYGGSTCLNLSDNLSFANSSDTTTLNSSQNCVYSGNWTYEGSGVTGSDIDTALCIDKTNPAAYRIYVNYQYDNRYPTRECGYNTVTNSSYISRIDEITTLRIYINNSTAYYTAENIGLYDYVGTFYQKSKADLGTNKINIQKLIEGSSHLQLSIGTGLAVQNGTLINTNPTAPSVMTGATSSVAGAAGLVPAPAAGDDTKFLSGDGTFKTVSASANDGTLTITNLAGTTVGTFTANQSANTTINLPYIVGTQYEEYTSTIAPQYISSDLYVQPNLSWGTVNITTINSAPAITLGNLYLSGSTSSTATPIQVNNMSGSALYIKADSITYDENSGGTMVSGHYVKDTELSTAIASLTARIAALEATINGGNA